MEPILQVIITAALSSAVGAIVSALFVHPLKKASEHVIEKAETDRATDDAMRVGMRALLWRELQTIHDTGTDAGGLTISQRRHLENVYGAYHALGGNGTGTRLYTDTMNLPVVGR